MLARNKVTFKTIREYSEPRALQVFYRFFLRSWWLLLFLLLCQLLYREASNSLNKELAFLEQYLAKVKTELERARERNEDLHLQIQSQSDHEWIELVLMKGLGLVPEGQRKVYFVEETLPKE